MGGPLGWVAGAPSIESASLAWAVAFGLQSLDHVPQMPDGESRFVVGILIERLLGELCHLENVENVAFDIEDGDSKADVDSA